MACGIVHSPKLIIMDEPTVGIDPQSRNRILENVKTLNEKGATILYTTHYMPEVEEICSKITVIDHGKVIASGTKEDIMDKMGKDREIDVTFTADSEGLSGFEKAIQSITSVRRYSTSTKEDIPTCKIFYSDDHAIIENVIRIAADHHLTITNIGSLEPSLEEIFLTLTGKELRDGK